MRGRLTNSPTVLTLLLLVAVFVLKQALSLVIRQPVPFALSNQFFAQPWTLVTSVYTHSGVSHLIINVLLLALFGVLVERRGTSGRFHLFFLGTGALSGLAEVSVATIVGPFVPGMAANVSVLGASGAILALLGYLLGANRITDQVVGGFELPPSVQLVLAGLVALLVTLLTATPGAALFAHFTGLFLGVLAGRVQLLRPA